MALLQDADDSVLTIAGEFGYANHALLAKKFKEKYGAAPLQYRKMHLTQNPLKKQ